VAVAAAVARRSSRCLVKLANRYHQDVTQVGMHEAKTKLSQLVTRAENGEEIVIARNGEPAVRLVPVERRSSMESIRGIYRGQVHIADDFDELPPEFDEAFGIR
jgi:prevent-host-death family protein